MEPWEANPRCLRSIKYHHQKNAKKLSSNQAANGRNQKNERSVGVTSDTTADNNKADGTKSQVQITQETTEWNSLIDEKAMASKKNRLTKEVELRKHVNTLNTLKKKLAKSIVNQTCSAGDLRQLSIEEFFRQAAEMEKERNEQLKIKMRSNRMPPGPEKDRVAE